MRCSYAPRQQPVPVGGLAGHRRPGAPAALRARRAASEVLRRIVSCWGADDLIDSAFALHEYAAATSCPSARCGVRFCEVPHYTATFAVELATNGARFTYGADCRPNDELVQFARDTDVLLIEATLPRPSATGMRGHLTAREAGEHGRRAGARRLVLTHYSDELDSDWARAEAADSFGGRGRTRRPSRANGVYDGRWAQLRRCRSVICSPTSNACAARWTSCSAMCSSASGLSRRRAGPGPRSTSPTPRIRRGRS